MTTEADHEQDKGNNKRGDACPKWKYLREYLRTAFWYTIRRLGWTVDKLNYVSPLLTALATGLVVWVAYWQWAEMHNTDDTLKKTIDISRDTSERTVRAYVLYNDPHILLLPNENRYLVSFSFKNRGQTPAYNVEYWFHSEVRNTPINVIEDVGVEDTGPASVDLDPTAEWPIEREFPLTSLMDVQNIREKKSAFYVWGMVTYRDVFKRCQFATFVVKNGREPPENSGVWGFDAVAFSSTERADCVAPARNKAKNPYPRRRGG
jgi:hypothetical protein